MYFNPKWKLCFNWHELQYAAYENVWENICTKMYTKMYTKIKEAIRAEAMSQIFYRLPRSTFAFPSLLAGIKQGQNMQQVNLFGSRNIFVFIYFYYRFVLGK